MRNNTIIREGKERKPCFDRGRPLYYSNEISEKQAEYIRDLRSEILEIDKKTKFGKFPTTKTTAITEIRNLKRKKEELKKKKNKEDFIAYMTKR